MQTDKVLAALSYFSIFFAPFLFPLVVWIVVDNGEVKRHAKLAFISHLVPVILGFAAFLIFTFSMYSFNFTHMEMGPNEFSFWTLAPVLFMLIYGILLLAIVVWNIVQGIKVLR